MNQTVPRNLDLPLSEVLFSCDLPNVLGVTQKYIKNLQWGGKQYACYEFPKPFFTFPDGVNVWRLSSIKDWALDYRRRGYQAEGMICGERFFYGTEREPLTGE